MDEAYCIQFTTADREPGLDPNGHSKGRTGPVSYWHVADIKDSCPAPTGGATEQQPVSDLGDRLIAALTDADGNVIGLIQTPGPA